MVGIRGGDLAGGALDETHPRLRTPLRCALGPILEGEISTRRARAWDGKRGQSWPGGWRKGRS